MGVKTDWHDVGMAFECVDWVSRDLGLVAVKIIQSNDPPDSD